jgi:thioredoxin-related protein
LFLNEQGKVALRLNGYYPPQQFRHALDFVAGKHEKQMSFASYVQQQAVSGNGELIREAFFSRDHDVSALIGRNDAPTAIVFEAPNCDECVTMHEKVLSDKPTRRLMEQFNSLQVNVFSKDKLTNEAGQSETMQDYARRLGIAYTPSVIFFDKQGKEVHRIEGFLKTFHFQSSLAYVLDQAYIQQPNFQRYIAARGEHIREQGYDTDIWGYESFHPENLK